MAVVAAEGEAVSFTADPSLAGLAEFDTVVVGPVHGAVAGLLAGAVPVALRPLALLGRWPLSFYMLHQPVFIGAILGGRLLGWW